MSLFHAWVWLCQERVNFHHFASVFKFFGNKCMKVHGINNDLVLFVETSPPQFHLKYSCILSSQYKKIILNEYCLRP